MKPMILLFILLLELTGCTNNQSIEKPSSSTVTVEENQMHKLSDQQLEELKPIVKNLFSDYLDSQKESSIPTDRRIKNYKIHDDIKIFKNETDTYFIVTFDTLAATNEFVVAGGGELDNNGWFINRTLFAEVNKVNDEYQLTIIGTGP